MVHDMDHPRPNRLTAADPADARSLGRLIRVTKAKEGGFRSVPPRRIMRAFRMTPGRYELTRRLWVLAGTTPTMDAPSQGEKSGSAWLPPRKSLRPLRAREEHRIDHGRTALQIKRTELLMLAPEREVIRVWQTPRADGQFLRDVEELQAGVRGPKLTAWLDGHAISHPWIPGRPIGSLPRYEQIEVIKALLRQLSASARRSMLPDECEFLRSALEVGARSTDHAATFGQLLDHPSTRLLGDGPLTLQHGDPGFGNIVIASDRRPTLIDWSPSTLGRRPFWSDAAHLVSFGDHGPLLEGDFDAELAALWLSVGRQPPEATALRRMMAFANALFFAMISLSIDDNGAMISLTTNRPPIRLSKPEKVVRALHALPSAALDCPPR